MSARDRFEGHTPEPWKLDLAEYPTSNDICLRADNGGDEVRIARVLFDVPEIGDEEASANARLLLAAPSLLAENARLREALRNLVEQCQRSVDGADEPDEQHGDEIQTVLGSSAWKQARAALAQEGAPKA